MTARAPSAYQLFLVLIKLLSVPLQLRMGLPTYYETTKKKEKLFTFCVAVCRLFLNIYVPRYRHIYVYSGPLLYKNPFLARKPISAEIGVHTVTVRSPPCQPLS